MWSNFFKKLNCLGSHLYLKFYNSIECVTKTILVMVKTIIGETKRLYTNMHIYISIHIYIHIYIYIYIFRLS